MSISIVPRGQREDGARRLLQKLLVTVLVGLVVYVLTDVVSPSQEEQWKVVLAVLCSGAVLIVQYMIAFTKQMGDLEEVVERRFTDIGEATELFNQVQKLRLDGVPTLAKSVTEIMTTGPEILHRFTHAEVERVAEQMKKLVGLSTTCPGENDDWMLTLTDCAETSIDAISTSVDHNFWDSEPAGRYLDAQAEAKRRGVKIRRLFIVENPGAVGSLDTLCKEQRDRGIDVQVVAVQQLPYIRRGTTIDFIIFDGVMTYDISTDLMGMNLGTRISAEPREVQKLVKRFRVLWEASRPGTPGDPSQNGAGAPSAQSQ